MTHPDPVSALQDCNTSNPYSQPNRGYSGKSAASNQAAHLAVAESGLRRTSTTLSQLRQLSVAAGKRLATLLGIAALAAALLVTSTPPPTAVAATAPSTEPRFGPGETAQIMVCSTDRPIRWTVAASPSAKSKQVRRVQRIVKRELAKVSQASGGLITYQYVPNAPVVSRESDPFAYPTTPPAVSLNRDIDFIVVVTAYGQPSFDDPFTSKDTSGVLYRSYNWLSDRTRPEQYQYDPPPSPLVVTAQISDKQATNTRSTTELLRAAAVETVYSNPRALERKITPRVKKKIRTYAAQACDPSVPRNYPGVQRYPDGSPFLQFG